MTYKQLTTLKLYALNYTYRQIGLRLSSSRCAIKERLRRVKKQQPQLFNDVKGIRSAFKKAKRNLLRPYLLSGGSAINGRKTRDMIFDIC